jgi:hypothetical protein
MLLTCLDQKPEALNRKGQQEAVKSRKDPESSKLGQYQARIKFEA